MSNGLQYVYTGNVHDKTGGSTWCPQCGHCVIERDWYELGPWGLTADGHCQQCGHAIAGRFADRPGHWGARQQVVNMAAYSTR
ncbi:MAG: hypothetical protein DRQ54_10490 [Gammaproteobacteria bacterium]|nr:MAG: hypothetical protein DRQ54_10490 [Gammaproteobacteria bacterium]